MEPRVIRSVFRGATVGPTTADWMPGNSAPDDEVKRSAPMLRARARQLSRDNALIGKFLELLTSNVLGAGGRPTLQADVRGANGEPDERINDAIEAAWDDWRTGAVTADGKWDLASFEQLQLETMATDGEAFTRMLTGMEFSHGLGLQAIDCDLVDELLNRTAGTRESEIRMGIEVDLLGRPQRYWVRDDPAYVPGTVGRRHYPVEAAEIIHLYRPRRGNQTRGITWFARVMYDLNMLAGYNEGELTASRAGSNKIGFIEDKDTSLVGGAGAEDPAAAGATSEATADSTGSATGSDPSTAPGGPYFEAEPGSVHRLPFGTTFQPWDPTHPSTAYPDFVRTIMLFIASGLGPAYHSLTSDLSKVNFSTAREAKLTEQKLWRILQGLFIAVFRRRVFEQWLQNSLLTGQLQLPSSDWRLYRRAIWIPQGFDWVDPEAESAATANDIAIGLTSRKREHAKRGTDRDQILRELAEEALLAKKLDIDIDGPKASPPATTVEKPEDAGENGNGNGRKKRSLTNRLTSARR